MSLQICVLYDKVNMCFRINIVWHIYCNTPLILIIMAICSYACNSATRFKVVVDLSSGGWRSKK